MKLATLSWEGDSRDVLSSFPREVKEDIGYALWQLQSGEIPENIRPMKSIGSGVFEIKESDERSWYRVIYLSKVGNTIYILHSFEKQSGKTEKRDLETARLRLAQVNRRLAEEARDAKHKEKKGFSKIKK